MWNLKRNDTHDLIYKTERDSQAQRTSYACQGERMVREFGMDMFLLLYFKWITKKDLLQRTWNSVSCGSLDGRGVWGDNGYMCVYDWVPSLFTQNCLNIVNQFHSNTKLKAFFFFFTILVSESDALSSHKNPSIQMCVLPVLTGNRD